MEVERPADKQGNREKTVGFKLPDGTIRVTDKGFDYNVGRLNYKLNLDLYPEKLAHAFAKVEMKGGEFKHDFELLAKHMAERNKRSAQMEKNSLLIKCYRCEIALPKILNLRQVS